MNYDKKTKLKFKDIEIFIADEKVKNIPHKVKNTSHIEYTFGMNFEVSFDEDFFKIASGKEFKENIKISICNCIDNLDGENLKKEMQKDVKKGKKQ